MILGSAQSPIVLLDGSSGVIEILLWLLAGFGVLAFSGFVGLLVALGVALDVKARVGLEIFCVVLAAAHIAAGIWLYEPARLPASISLAVGALELCGAIIGRLRRRRRRQVAADTPE